MSFFDFHHHKPGNLGIFNLKNPAENYANDFSTGINPIEIPENWKDYLEKIEKTSTDKNCAAIGECGLDSRFPDEKLQREIFLKHLQLAENLQKPIIIHCVRKFEEVIFLAKNFTIPKIIHGYNKDEKTAQLLLENDFRLSFGSALLHNLSLQQIFAKIPVEKIFLETDDSDADIGEIYQKASEIKNIRPENLQKIINQNLNEIFSLKNG